MEKLICSLKTCSSWDTFLLPLKSSDFNFEYGKLLDLNNTISRSQAKQLCLKWSSAITYSTCYNGILLGLILSKSSSIKQIRQHSYKYADQQIAPGNELTKNCCIRHMRPNILKTELSSDTSSLAICFDTSSLAICFLPCIHHENERYCHWLLPLFDSELFGYLWQTDSFVAILLY